MDGLTFVTHGPEETYLVGKKLGENLRPGDVVALTGELGAGKTCLTQGIARGVGIPEEYRITSPTFTLINEYPGRFALYHMDMYRLSGIKDLAEIGYDASLYEKGVVVVEWAEKIHEMLPEETIFVSLTYEEENKRQIAFSGKGERLADIMKAMEGGS